jgi:uncharacterized protein YegL
MAIAPSIKPGWQDFGQPATPFTPVKNVINHIVLLLDASGSMEAIRREVVKVADQEIQHLAQQSQKLDQETRVTVYTFASRGQFQCLVFDKDVLRLPSIATLYRADGNTALIDATLAAISELKQTCTLHGDHSFLIYVLTDGQENHSVAKGPQLAQAITALPENWTLAAFVPNKQGMQYATQFGFPANNVAIWTGDAKGMNDVGDIMRSATANYMTARSLGQRGTKNLFQLSTAGLKPADVKATLTELHFGQYRLVPVALDCPIAEFVEGVTNRPYKLGEAYYELMKPETIQATKNVVIKHRKTHKLYQGKEAREVLSLPAYDVRVNPESSPEWQIFVQSTSVNRKLIGGTSLVILS